MRAALFCSPSFCRIYYAAAEENNACVIFLFQARDVFKADARKYNEVGGDYINEDISYYYLRFIIGIVS